MNKKLFIGIGAVIVIAVGFICFSVWFLSGIRHCLYLYFVEKIRRKYGE